LRHQAFFSRLTRHIAMFSPNVPCGRNAKHEPSLMCGNAGGLAYVNTGKGSRHRERGRSIYSPAITTIRPYNRAVNRPGSGQEPMIAPAPNFTHRINRFRRMLGTGLSFVIFGLAAVFVSSTIFPYLRATSPDAETARRRIQRGMRRTFRVFMEIMR